MDKWKMGDLMPKLDLNQKQLEYCKNSDRDQLKKKLGTNMKEGLDNYYVVARTSVVKNQEMLDNLEETDEEREAMIKNVMKDRKHAKTK